ncbi:hypothetical protein MRX96_010962 [Rhipicephalus microplus]
MSAQLSSPRSVGCGALSFMPGWAADVAEGGAVEKSRSTVRGVDARAIFRCWMERCWSVMQENRALSGLVAADSVEGLDTACSSEHLHNKCEGREGIPHVGTTVKPTLLRVLLTVLGMVATGS